MTGFRYTGSRPDRAAIRAVLGGDPNRGLGRSHEARARRVLEAARRGVPVRSGKLRNTLRMVRGRNQYGPYIHIVAGSPGTPYLGYVLFGTEPHIIRPRRRKALRFVVAGGTVVFARKVRHPGTRPDDFLRAALVAAR